MAHIARSIELHAPVDTIHQEWLRFEGFPRSPVRSLVANVRWRAEVLTFEPTDAGTRVTLKIEYDPTCDEGLLSRRLEGVMQSFTSYLERGREVAAASFPA